jgi:hypothetical protein
MVTRNDYGMSEQQQTFHAGNTGSNPVGDASTYVDSPDQPTPQQPQKPKYVDKRRNRRRPLLRSLTPERREFERVRNLLNAARSRCRNPKVPNYGNYGGRGIWFSDEFSGRRGARRFLALVGQRPSRLYTLDRIDNDRGYEPGNVRWATRHVQRMNRRDMKPLAKVHPIPQARRGRVVTFSWDGNDYGVPRHVVGLSPAAAYDIVWRGLGARRGETIYQAARRARYHGHERAAASELVLGIQDEWTPDEKWQVIREAAFALKPRVERDDAERRRT